MPPRATQHRAPFAAAAAILLAVSSLAGIAHAGDPPAAAPPASATATPSSSTAPDAPPAASPPASDTAPAPADTPAPAASSAPDAKPTAPADPEDKKPARPPPLESTENRVLPWDHLLDIGGDLAIVARPATGDAKGQPSRVRYELATGFALHLRFPIIKHLQIEGYFVDCHLPVTIPRGALGTMDTIVSPPVETFVFGARITPNITWGRVTASATAGAGWGRMEFQRMTATTATGAKYTLRERGGSFVELPLGVGVSIEVVKRWLSIDLRATAAFVVEPHGEAFDAAQTVDPSGKLQNVSPMPIMDASIVQTIGFSLLL